MLPRRELFSRERREPSASVILGMLGSIRLGPEQVMAIQHLVAAAVPDLSPGRISIVDDRGSLLARGFEDKLGAGTLGANSDERRRAYELRLSRTIEELLEKTVGFGNVRAEVSAEMDFDRINTAEETFDPDGQVVRSTQTIEETVSSREAEGVPAVSVAINLPDAGGGSDSASSTSAEQRTEETVNFEISKKVVNHVRDTGGVKAFRWRFWWTEPTRKAPTASRCTSPANRRRWNHLRPSRARRSGSTPTAATTSK